MNSTAPTIDSNRSDTTVTAIIVHDPSRENWSKYERWLLDIAQACKRFDGYLSTDVIRPVGSQTTFTVIIRFSSITTLQTWMESDLRREFLYRIDDLLEKVIATLLRQAWISGLLPRKSSHLYVGNSF